MKKVYLFIMVCFLLVGCSHKASAQETNAKKAFLEQFYNEWDANEEGIPDNDLVKQYVTDDALQILKDNFEFDCDGECLATWMFCYEGGGDVGGLLSRTFTVADENNIVVAHKYTNYEYDVQLTVIKVGKTYKIDNIQQLRSVWLDN